MPLEEKLGLILFSVSGTPVFSFSFFLPADALLNRKQGGKNREFQKRLFNIKI